MSGKIRHAASAFSGGVENGPVAIAVLSPGRLCWHFEAGEWKQRHAGQGIRATRVAANDRGCRIIRLRETRAMECAQDLLLRRLAQR